MNIPIDITNTILNTKRLTIRPWRMTDADDLYEYASVDGVGQMAGWTPHKNVEESMEIIRMFMDEKKTFALEYQGKVIGSVGIEEYAEEDMEEYQHLKGREIGFVLSKDYWGQGLMPEAVKAVIKWLFETVGLDFIVIGHFDWNSQSRRVIEKCGFRYMKTTRFETRFDTVENSKEYILYHPERRENHVNA